MTLDKKEIIPICFALDEGYIMPTTVAVKSMLARFNSNKLAHVFFLVPDSFNEKKAAKLNEIVSNAKNVFKYDYIKVSDQRFNDKCTIRHITYPTYYRLIMADRIPYDKCIYLDGDIIVLQDVSQMMSIEMDDNYIAGVPTPYFQLRKRDKKEAMKRLGIDSFNLYVNAGVLIFNLRSIRDDKMEEKFIRLLDKNFPVQDQDIINSACYPNICLLPGKFNCVEEFFSYPIKELMKVYSEKELQETRNKPVVFHFANQYKPWKYKGLSFEKEWFCVYRSIYKTTLERKPYMINKIKDRIISIINRLVKR